MYQRVDGQQEAEDGDRNGAISPESFTRSLPRGYWGSLDTPQGDETSQLSFSDALEPSENLNAGINPTQQKSEVVLEARPAEGDPDGTNPWTPGFLARIPRLGFLAMVFNIMITIVSIIVLVLSNNSQVDHWNDYFQPSVWLSATSTLANMSLTLALTQGLIIAFWRKAGKGSTLGDLHLYANGASLFTVLSTVSRSVRSPGSFFITLACIFSTLSAFRGPIVQRASTIASVSVPTTGNMTLNVAQLLSTENNPLGFLSGSGNSVSYLSRNFTNIVQNFTARDDIYIDAPDCGVSCTAIVQGYGFKPDCDTGTFNFHFQDSDTLVNETTVFESRVLYTVGMSTEENSQFTLNVTYLDNGVAESVTESSSKAWHNCTLEKAIVEYPVLITGNTIVLQNATLNYLPSDEIDLPIHLSETEFWAGGYLEITAESTVIGGFGFYLDSLFASSSILSNNGSWYLESEGMYANIYMNLSDSVIQPNTTWRDPMPDMLSSVNDLTFRTAVQVALDNPTSAFAQNVVYNGMKITTIYQSNYGLMAVAVAINFLGLFSILPVYYGWWELGRKTSLSPLETAKAFGAPLLRDVDDNATAEQILKKAGEMRVMYGESFASSRLSGSEFLIPRKAVRGRLQIVEEESARRPEIGNVFGSKML